jgi:hypothetical protein
VCTGRSHHPSTINVISMILPCVQAAVVLGTHATLCMQHRSCQQQSVITRDSFPWLGNCIPRRLQFQCVAANRKC